MHHHLNCSHSTTTTSLSPKYTPSLFMYHFIPSPLSSSFPPSRFLSFSICRVYPMFSIFYQVHHHTSKACSMVKHLKTTDTIRNTHHCINHHHMYNFDHSYPHLYRFIWISLGKRINIGLIQLNPSDSGLCGLIRIHPLIT